jgi:gas vesicle protein
MLIRAAYSNVMYLRAQSKLQTAEAYLIMEMDGGLTNSDEDMAKKRYAGRGDTYKKEAEQWHKEYMELLNDLKLTRKQRLDKIKDNRNTFLDLQQELMTKVRQESLVEEIKRIQHATEDELRRMAKGEVGPDGQRHSWLVGAFDEFLETPLNAEPPKQLDEIEE